jgi:putative transposase
MSGPQPAPVTLTTEEADGLAAVVRRHTAPQQLVSRARSILLAADGLTNSAIARQVGLSVATVRLWRTRWLRMTGVALADLSVEERLADAPRLGRPARITAEQFCQLVALACEAPGASARPISQWSGREIADEAVTRGIVATISPRHAARLLKRGTSNPTACVIG